MTRKRKILGGLFLLLDVLWAAFIFGRSLQPASASGQESGTLLALVQRLLPQMTDHVLRKLAHFTEYFCLGALWYSIPFLWKKAGRKSIPSVAGILLLSAAADEFHQYFIPGRNASVRDVLIDVAGGMTAVAVLWIIKRLKRRLCTG